jgi:adenylosuccinate lyase
MAATRRGVGRETAHEAIKEHAVAVALGLRAGAATNDLFDRLAADPRLGLDRAEIDALTDDGSAFVGAASAQVAAIAERVATVVAKHPSAGAYAPAPIL